MTWAHCTTILLIGVLAAGAAEAAPAAPDGAAVFKARCAKCHGASGMADTSNARALKVRPLVNDTTLALMAPADIAKAIKSDPKHRGMAAVTNLDEKELGAVAVFVKELASKH